jgi:membrane associated rhomboid family serine protease
VIKELFSSFIIPASLVAVLVLVKLAEYTFDIDLGQFGVYPRKISELSGVLSYPFIHANWKHLFNNSTALLVLGTMLYYFYRPVASKTLLWVYLLSGFWLWVGGRPNFHIGASGIVYALFGFLFVSGLLRKHLKLMALSLLVVFLYGSLVWGVFPVDDTISYEGHLFGLIAGIVVAYVYRKQGIQQPKYSWDLVEEEEVPDWYPDPDRKPEPEIQPQIKIEYIYKKKDGEADRN